MLITHYREKLINVILFFAQNVRALGKTKLFKLLYFLDFEHYRETGRSVTGMDYFAWKMGPIPVDLADEVEAPEPDMSEKVSFSETPTRHGRPMLKVDALADFDETHFTPRELRLMRRLADEFRDAQADEMVEATHLENTPWHRVYVTERHQKQKIPYDYVLPRQDMEIMLPIIREREAMIEHFSA